MKKLLWTMIGLGLISAFLWQTYQGIQASAARQANMQALKDALAELQRPGCDAENDQLALAAMRDAVALSPIQFAALGQTAEFQRHNRDLQSSLIKANLSCAEKSKAITAIDKQCKACHAVLRSK